jgi:hypothetical protein
MIVIWVRTIIVAALIVVAAGCSKSNPLLGKWKLAADANPACAGLDGVEFTDKTMTMNILGKQMAAVTYSRDGDRYLVSTPNGMMAFEKNSDGIKAVTPFECQLLPAN